VVLNDHRDKVDRYLIPLARRYSGVHPNTLTWISMVYAVMAAICLYLGHWLLLIPAFVCILLNALFDALDGKVAHITGKASKRGDFLDHVIDRYADVIILLGITLGPYGRMGISLGQYGRLDIGLFAIIGVLLTSYMGTQAQAMGAGRNYRGILGRAERMVILMLVPLFQFVMEWLWQPTIYGYNLFIYMLVLFAVAGNLTALSRFAQTWKELRE